MAHIVFKDLRYRLPEEYTSRELILMEQVSGLTVGEIDAHIKRGVASWGLLCAMAHVAMKRAGATVSLDDLLDAPVNVLGIEQDEKEDDASGPPASDEGVDEMEEETLAESGPPSSDTPSA